jgi:hypothetical protein
MARIYLNVGENRSIKESDYYDAEHWAAATYADVLVRDDAAMTDTMKLISRADLIVEGFEAFELRLASLSDHQVNPLGTSR